MLLPSSANQQRQMTKTINKKPYIIKRMTIQNSLLEADSIIVHDHAMQEQNLSSIPYTDGNEY